MPTEVPVYEPLLTLLRSRIHSKRLRPGHMLGTEVGLAAQSGISRSSVREAISILAKEGLIERRPGKGIFVREAPRDLVIEMILPNLSGTWAGGLVDAAQTVARENLAKLQVFSADGNFEADLSAIRRLPQMKVSGAIIVSLHHIRLSQQVIELHQQGFPLVLLDQRLRDVDIPSVTCDDLQAGSLAAARLVSLGHRRIGFVGFQHDDGLPSPRQEGYRNALSDAGIVIDRSLEVLFPYALLTGPDKNAGGALRKLFSRRNPPTALVVQNFRLATLCLALADRLRVGRDVDFLTFAARREMESADSRLAFVEIPEAALGAAAARLLLDRISHPGRPARHMVIPTRLFARS